MKIPTILILTYLTGTAVTEPCFLSELCENNEGCTGSTLKFEIVGNPPDRVLTNFGDFGVDGTSAAGEATSKVRLSNGTEYVVTSKNSLMIASQKNENSRSIIYFVQTPPSTLTATLVVVPQKYVDYSKTFNARRVFEGDCEQEF
ncbi:hypothetical protein [Ruegeria sp. THAF57]|uniref:hypothetical protein n=1 Tax=Ruegeria sp. THAF57 TaxID=2744555 RepID=UPI0015DEDDF9|nr:hypothetical protein [Ruegeria sp. THAF57]